MPKPRKMIRTKNQIEIMGIVLRAAGAGVFLSMKEIHEQISYGSAYGSIRTSLRFLINKEMLIRKDEGTKTMMVPTEKGYDWFRPLRT